MLMRNMFKRDNDKRGADTGKKNDRQERWK